MSTTAEGSPRGLSDEQLEHLADSTPGIDPWCSGPDWIFPAHAAFAPRAEVVDVVEPGQGVALLARHPSVQGMVLGGREPLWGFACPVLTNSSERFAKALAARLADDPTWSRLVLPGMPGDAVLLRTFGTAFLDHQVTTADSVGGAEGITRQIIDLADGYDAWWMRRSAKFRRGISQARNRAETAGFTFTDASTEPHLIERLVRIEMSSWKGMDNSGITTPEMQAFYRAMLDRLQHKGRLRCTIAQQHGHDVGYIVGGVRGSRYRGLQLSYTEDVAKFSVSHLLQRREIEALCASEINGERVATYDMGMDMDYKQRWADHSQPSLVLVVDRKPA